MQSEKVVRVTKNGSGLPVPDQDPISVKKDNQKVRWSADFDFDIEITGYSDVQKTTVGGETRVTSGTFADVKRYKYTIKADGVENDPDVEVLP